MRYLAPQDAGWDGQTPSRPYASIGGRKQRRTGTGADLRRLTLETVVRPRYSSRFELCLIPDWETLYRSIIAPPQLPLAHDTS